MDDWVNVREYEDNYKINKRGVIKNIKTGKTISTHICKGTGYIMVNLWKNGKRKLKSLHRVLAESFIENIENNPCVNHKDGNKNNNSLSNLEWVTYSENTNHAYLNKLLSKGEGHYKARLDTTQVIFIKYWLSLGYRQKEIAENFKVSKSLITDINTKRTWRDVK